MGEVSALYIFYAIVEFLLMVLILRSVISRFGSKRMGINAWEPNDRADLALLAELFKAGEVVPVIDKRYPLHEVPEAFRRLGEGHAMGKIVVFM